jgi:hypothetical protein
MKMSLAELKRRMKVGSQWEFYAPHWLGDETKIRTVTHSQSNGFAMTSPNDSNISSWLYYPKVSEILFINDNDGKYAFRIDMDKENNAYLYYKEL